MSDKANFLSSTPVLFVASIEAVLPFWVERLGFTQATEVPHGGVLGFVILVRDEVQIMVQTLASGSEDVPSLAAEQSRGPTFLFIKVADLDAVEAALQGVEVIMPRRTTFYGATEIGYREPGGHCVTFAQFAAEG
jgi:uncharacterized glyoxalase superfamily protein PhnB